MDKVKETFQYLQNRDKKARRGRYSKSRGRKVRMTELSIIGVLPNRS